MDGNALTGDEFVRRVRALRATGLAPKAIARALGVPPARVAPIVRILAAEAAATIVEGDQPLIGCWVNPGWSEELRVAGHPRWPTGKAALPGTSGLVNLLVARQAPRGRMRVFGYLVDTFCLGVKDVVGPKIMDLHLLDGYLRFYYEAYECLPLAAPLDLVQHVVFGAIEYAESLGLQPTPDFTAEAAAHLGPWTPPSAVTFGRRGKPLYIQGPRDDTARIMATLRRTVGDDGFHYLVGLGDG